MKKLSLGITNENLAKILTGTIDEIQNIEPEALGKSDKGANTQNQDSSSEKDEGINEATNDVKYYSISGAVSGLTDSVTLRNNGGDDIFIKPGDNSNFTFLTSTQCSFFFCISTILSISAIFIPFCISGLT
jgi:hypothetical protein